MKTYKFYYTYKITLLKGSYSNCYYLGQHKTNNLNDNYAGSGTKLRNYYNKYGKSEGDSYVKEILNSYSSLKELNEAEKILIGNKWDRFHEDYDPSCLNLKGGGDAVGLSDEVSYRCSHKGKDNPMYGKCKELSPVYGKHFSEETNRKKSLNHSHYWTGRKQSEESKIKKSVAIKKHWEEYKLTHPKQPKVKNTKWTCTKAKRLWLTPEGNIVEMTMCNVHKWHKDWKLIEK